jgi:hypothetical protein
MDPMRGMFLLLFSGVAWLAACSPPWNWRELRLEGAPLTIRLPCKPEHASQTVTLAGAPVLLLMTGCENAGATLAVSRVLLSPGGNPGAALAQWRGATLVGMRAQAVSEQAFQPPGSLALPESVRLVARGQSRDGRPVSAQAAWFASATPQGVWLFHAVMYADAIAPEGADTFFEGLRLKDAP